MHLAWKIYLFEEKTVTLAPREKQRDLAPSAIVHNIGKKVIHTLENPVKPSSVYVNLINKVFQQGLMMS